MKTATTNKLKIKDIITVVLLSLINVVIFFASSLLYATPITIILMPVFFALLEGVVYFIIGTKVKKPGAILIYSIVRAIMGGYLPYIILLHPLRRYRRVAALEDRLRQRKSTDCQLHHQSGVCRFRKHCHSLCDCC